MGLILPGTRRGLAAALLLATACSPCPLYRHKVEIRQPDEALEAQLAACRPLVRDGGEPDGGLDAGADAGGHVGSCASACDRVFRLVAQRPDRQALESCYVDRDSNGRAIVTLTYRADCS